MAKQGTLFLCPSLLGGSNPNIICEYEKEVIENTTFFIAERARECRRFIKKLNPKRDIDALTIMELDKHNTNRPKEFLAPLLGGINVAFMSDAGCPAIADPGSKMVAFAHEKSCHVEAIPGPSSILMALMNSGFNGQRFTFNGYLPKEESNRSLIVKQMETRSKKENSAQIFMETPYRNNVMMRTALRSLMPTTLLHISCNVTLPDAFVVTKSIADWQKEEVDLHKKPTVFCLQA